MFNKLILISIFIILFGFDPILAQSHKKLEKLSQKENYDKLISKSKKGIQRKRNDSIAYYYLIKGLLLKSEHNTGTVAERSYFRATYQLNKYRKYFESDTIILNLNDEFHSIGLKVISELSERNKRRRKYYTVFFADYLSDTLECYHEYFPVDHGTNTIPIESAETYFCALDYLNSEKIMREKCGLKYATPSVLPPRELIIQKSKEALGSPWVYTGMTPEKGFDCSGFILWTFGQFGYEFPHKTKMLAKIGKPVNRNDIRKADLVCFGSSSYSPERVYHVGLIYSVSNDSIKMIHCGTSTGVKIVSLSNGYWSEKDHFIVRIAE